MADKKISIIVEAVVGAARRELQGLKKDLNEIRSEFDATAVAAGVVGGAVIALGVAFAAAKFAEKAIEIADAAAATARLRDGFESLAARSQIDSKLLLDSLKEASRGTISEYDLMQQANKAWYLGVAKNVSQYANLMKIAEVKSKDLGISTVQYWERLTSALASGYPAMLRNLGVVIDNEQAYRDYGAMIGVSADALTDQEQIQARVNAVIAQGESTLRQWETAEKDAITVTQEFHAVAADLREEFAERLLPVLIPGIEAITTAIKASRDPMARQQEVLAQLIEETGSLAEAEIQLAKGLYAGGQGFVSQEMAAQQAATAILDYKIARMGIDAGIQEDIRAMRMADKAVIDWSEHERDATRDTEELTSAVEKASDTYDKYVRDVEAANYRFGRSVADASFRAAQAAETAAFRRYEIQRDAGQKYEDDLRKHTRDIRRQWQDLHDALADIEWDYQQDRKDLLKRSPWWIRQALQKEFAERKRIAQSGDAKALEAFDKTLRERIRAIDPIYAEELDELEEQFDRKESVEKREARQARKRTKDDFRDQNRITRRELRDQLKAWRFHSQQRRENERHAMDNLIGDHAHRLQVLYDNTNRRLADMDAIWQHWGWAHGTSYIDKLRHVLSTYAPRLPGPETPPGWEPYEWWPMQQGAWEVPQTMPAIIHKGEMVVPAGPAEQIREGGGAITIEIGQIVLGGGYSPHQGRQLARDMAEELGPMIRKQSR